jgi:hypothetical protein
LRLGSRGWHCFSGGGAKWHPGSSAAVATLIMPAFAVMLLGPSLSSIGMTAMESGHPGLRALVGPFGKWRLGKWYAAALITPSILLSSPYSVVSHLTSCRVS